jgi:hypothetical protein
MRQPPLHEAQGSLAAGKLSLFIVVVVTPRPPSFAAAMAYNFGVHGSIDAALQYLTQPPLAFLDSLWVDTHLPLRSTCARRAEAKN